MRLQQLEYLLEIAQSQSITIASKNLYVGQPALSRSIKTLEDELEIPLLLRTSSGVSITEEGQILLPYIKKVIEDVEEIKFQAKQLTNNHQTTTSLKGTFNIYTLPIIADSLLLPALEEMTTRYPLVDITVNMLEMTEPITLNIPETADLIISIDIENLLEEEIAKSQLQVQSLFIGNYVLVVGEQHPLANKKIVTRNEVVNLKLIGHHNGVDLGKLYASIDQDIAPFSLTLQSNNARVITDSLLKQNTALITTQPLFSIDYAHNKQLKSIPIKNSRYQCYALYHAHSKKLQLIQEFTALIKNTRSL